MLSNRSCPSFIYLTLFLYNADIDHCYKRTYPSMVTNFTVCLTVCLLWRSLASAAQQPIDVNANIRQVSSVCSLPRLSNARSYRQIDISSICFNNDNRKKNISQEIKANFYFAVLKCCNNFSVAASRGQYCCLYMSI